jgi:hypothetical protein
MIAGGLAREGSRSIFRACLNRSASMSRDWDSEWEVLLGRERAAFRVRNGAFGELMPQLARCAPVDMELSGRVIAADKAWKAAKADVAAFMADYRRAA